MKINGIAIDAIVKKAIITSPVMKESLDSPPGGHGVIDTSTILTDGEPTYEPRTLTMRVIEHATTPRDGFRNRLRTWHGRILDICPDDMPGHYTGRARLSSYSPRGHEFAYILTARVNPWRWDDHDTLVTVHATSAGTGFTLHPSSMTLAPLITTPQAVTVTVGTHRWGVPAGTQDKALPKLVLRPDQPISGTITGTGDVIWRWRGGDLI